MDERTERTRIWWIDSPMLAGTPHPTDAELECLKDQGFTAIVSLLDQSEQLRYSVRAATALGFSWHSIPVRDHTAPALEQFGQFQELLEREQVHGKILVHCEGGSGRTGTFAAAYWISRGRSTRESIEIVRGARSGAVENEEQRERLLEWEDSLRQ